MSGVWVGWGEMYRDKKEIWKDGFRDKMGKEMSRPKYDIPFINSKMKDANRS